jgi:hypothetical protein
MGGILSPDGESVLHESKWVEAILSPDESMYYHEGEWYSLNEKETNAIPVVEKSPPERPEVRSNDNGAMTRKTIAAIFAVVLLWGIFDSGSIVSYAELSGMDCSIWDDDSEFFDISGVQESCNETKSEASNIVTIGFVGLVFCLAVIVLPSNSTPETRVTKSRRRYGSWECENGCGFNHIEADVVKTHEKNCPLLKRP